MTKGIAVEIATALSDELVEALARLVPQLSPTARVPTSVEIQEIIASSCTTLVIARDRAAGGRIVGSLILIVFRVGTGLRAWIEDVVVDATARGKGVGEAMNREALAIAASAGAATVDLTSRPAREAANRLYQRLGFRSRETNVYRYVFDEGEREL